MNLVKIAGIAGLVIGIVFAAFIIGGLLYAHDVNLWSPNHYPRSGILGVGGRLTPQNDHAWGPDDYEITVVGMDGETAVLLVQNGSGRQAVGTSVVVRKENSQRVPVGVRCEKIHPIWGYANCHQRTAAFSYNGGDQVFWKVVDRQ